MVKITNIAITKKLSGAGFFDKKVFLPDIEALPIGLGLSLSKEIVLVMGPNGAGKTTFLKAIQQEGKGPFDTPGKVDTQYCVLQTDTGETPFIQSNLNLARRVEVDRGKNQKDLIRDLTGSDGGAQSELLEPTLRDPKSALLGEINLTTISGGQVTILELRRLLTDSQDRITLLDEPDLNLDQAGIIHLGDAIRQTFEKNSGRQVFICTHNQQLKNVLLWGDNTPDIINFCENPVSISSPEEYRQSLRRYVESNPNPFL